MALMMSQLPTYLLGRLSPENGGYPRRVFLKMGRACEKSTLLGNVVYIEIPPGYKLVKMEVGNDD